MKIKHLLIGLLAVAAAVSCKQEEVVETPSLELDKTSVSLAATSGEASFNVTTNQAWVATADADWVSLDPSSGEASSEAVTVKVTAEDNESTEARTATVTVQAGELTKTVEVSQAAGTGDEPGPGPELQKSEWALVGNFSDENNWNPASDLYLSVLDEEYFVYYGFELAATTEFKFLKGGAWPPAGQEIGGNGLVEPNTIQPAGGSNIKVTEAGKYDIYLAADLTKFYVMSEGKLPSEATEPAPVENSWGMMGCFVDNQWASDVPMTKEGEWIVAKGAQFTELTFKIRANSSWADATNIGVAPGSERGVVNGKISVVTAEYSKANYGGDAADIKLNGEAGTYDVYFSFENLEVYVMEEGFKPGEKEPQTPDPVEITYTVVGTIADNAWVNNAAAGLMVAEGDYLVAKNVPFVWNSTCYGGDYNRIEFKIVETGTWDGFAYPEKNVDQYANAEIAVSAGGENIAVDAPEGSYDVYFDKANLKVWVMEAGYKPGEKEPLVPEPANTIDHKQWMVEVDGMPMLIDLDLVEEGALVVAIPLMDNSGFGLQMSGTYEVAATDATSGTISFVQYDAEFDEFLPAVTIAYSNLTATTVDVVCEAIFGTASPLTLTLVENPYDIELDAGGEGPQGEIEDGVYWLIEPTSQKVMAALAETSTYGRPSAVDAINGASTAKNAFTFEYDSEWTAYVIKDSYGRYLYNDMQADGVTPYQTLSVATELPKFYDPVDSEANASLAPKENYAYFMWQVWGNGDGTYEIANASTLFSFGYSSSYNNWELADAWADAYTNLMPSLVKADNPVAEPEVPAGPVEATVAEFLAAAEDETVYQLTGVITSVANTTYGNFYLKDDTGEVYIYGLCSPEGAAKYWAESGAKVGDTITVQTVRTSYNGTAQGKNAIFVSLVPCEPEPEPELPEGSVAASATFSTFGYANAEVVDGVEIAIDENVKVVFKQGGATTAPAYYDSGEAIRMYQNGATLDVTATGKTITSIELTFANNQYFVAADSGELSAEASVRTWTGEAESVKFTSTGTDKNHRAYVSAIKVIYK